MNRLFIVLLFFISYSIYAQVPQTFNFQGIARNGSGTPLANTPIQLRLSILDAPNGSTLYSETKSVTTNAFGIYTVVINDGTGTSTNNFGSINFAAGDRYLKTEIDPANGTAFTDIGTTKLNSVPYALEAGRPKLTELKDVSASSPATGSVLSWNGSTWVSSTPAAAAIATATFVGGVAPIHPNPKDYIFVGDFATITLTETKRVTGSAVAALGFTSNPGNGSAYVQLCYQRTDVAGPVTSFTGNDYIVQSLADERRSYPSAGSITLGPGKYRIGLGVKNNYTKAINDNDFVNGWVMIY